MAAIIRSERDSDQGAIFDVNCRAFGRSDEAALVDALRRQADPFLSLVALTNGRIAGHILFSPVSVEPDGLGALALGPMAVDPERRRQGIGSQLVRAGLQICRDELKQPAVFVLGHPEYYPRFGFQPAAPKGLYFRDHSFDPAFMVAELEPGALQGMVGRVRYLPPFEDF